MTLPSSTTSHVASVRSGLTRWYGTAQSQSLVFLVGRDIYELRYRVRSLALERLERCEGKFSRTVLRGGSGREVVPLPGIIDSRSVSVTISVGVAQLTAARCAEQLVHLDIQPLLDAIETLRTLFTETIRLPKTKERKPCPRDKVHA